jgi:uncharacterized protein YneF (UPF0154 family)
VWEWILWGLLLLVVAVLSFIGGIFFVIRWLGNQMQTGKKEMPPPFGWWR